MLGANAGLAVWQGMPASWEDATDCDIHAQDGHSPPQKIWSFSKQQENRRGSLHTATRYPWARHLQHLPYQKSKPEFGEVAQLGLAMPNNADHVEAAHLANHRSPLPLPMNVSASLTTHGWAFVDNLLAAVGIIGVNSSSSMSSSTLTRETHKFGTNRAKAIVRF
jgi:hypothetical protein